MKHTATAPTWDTLPGPVEIVTEAGPRRHSLAHEVFDHFREIEARRTPILAVVFHRETLTGTARFAASPVQVGTLNVYLGTAGLRGFARTLGPGRFRPQTRWDLQALFGLCGFAPAFTAALAA